MKLVLGTYNIQHCGDNSIRTGEDLPVNMENTASMLNEMNCDIFGLNEVYEKGPGEEFCSQAKKLSELTDREHFVYGQGKEFEWGDIIGNAVFSRFPIVETELIPVPAPAEEERRPGENDWYEDRVIVKATVDVGRKITFFSTHFGLNRQEKERMVAKLAELLDAEEYPCVLCGDFNERPHSEVLKPIYDRMKSAADVMGATDVLTWASFAPQVTIDYIFVSKEFKVLSYQVPERIVSDHRPVRAEAELAD